MWHSKIWARLGTQSLAYQACSSVEGKRVSGTNIYGALVSLSLNWEQQSHFTKCLKDKFIKEIEYFIFKVSSH